ncbi:MAG: hypothetical protein K2J63_04185, partial [Muribaculaceae bacterium]|nr:hypothetical protein [Muribaculaceae bacterium]
MKSFGTYLNTQKEAASKDLKIKIQAAQSDDSEVSKVYYYPILTTNDRLKVEIWHTPLYSLSENMEGSMIEEQSDLILKPSVGNVRPLILTSNNVYSDMVYTNGNTMWDRKNRGFDYDDVILKTTPITQRTTLPNGQFYPDGFIYEHDFLADTLIQLPYQLNKDKYFDGNVEGLEEDETIGLIPPVKEEYFDYFTADDLRENLRMKVTHNRSAQVDKVEVTLKLPTTTGREIFLKKTYYLTESLKTSIQDVISAPDRATGLIGQCGVAVNALPFNRAFAENNYYAFQLYVDTYGLDGYCINLNACRYVPKDGDAGHEIKKTFSRYIRRKENGVPVITSYSLDGDNFDYLKLTFKGKKEEDRQLSALLIPRIDIQRYERNPGKKLEFCFDFGTSNTFVAVKDMESGLYIDFKLPTGTGMVVSTMTDDPTNANDITVKSFIAYSKQAFLPKVKDRLPFPISTVLSAPKNPDESAIFAPVKEEDETLTNPFFAGSIPFLYGSEDYDNQTNRIISNLKWAYRKKVSKEKHFTASFINELLFLAQIFAMSKHADLNQCSIYWTYPLSMDKKMIESLQQLWIKGYQKYFEGLTEDSEDNETHKNVNSFPESMAPMLFYTSDEKYKINSSDTTISVDIGGGTCDLVIIPSKLSKLKLTSFGFGAECIFGINA